MGRRVGTANDAALDPCKSASLPTGPRRKQRRQPHPPGCPRTSAAPTTPPAAPHQHRVCVARQRSASQQINYPSGPSCCPRARSTRTRVPCMSEALTWGRPAKRQAWAPLSASRIPGRRPATARQLLLGRGLNGNNGGGGRRAATRFSPAASPEQPERAAKQPIVLLRRYVRGRFERLTGMHHRTFGYGRRAHCSLWLWAQPHSRHARQVPGARSRHRRRIRAMPCGRRIVGSGRNWRRCLLRARPAVAPGRLDEEGTDPRTGAAAASR